MEIFWTKKWWPVVLIILVILVGLAGFVYSVAYMPLFAKQFLWLWQLGMILFGWWVIDKFLLKTIDTLVEIKNGNVAMALAFFAYCYLASTLVGQV